MKDEDLLDIFTYHPPTLEERGIYEAVNTEFQELVVWLNDGIVDFDSESGKNALRKLADARMAVNAAVALKDKW